MGNNLRLQLECRRDGYEPRILTAELAMDDQSNGFAELLAALPSRG